MYAMNSIFFLIDPLLALEYIQYHTFSVTKPDSAVGILAHVPVTF